VSRSFPGYVHYSAASFLFLLKLEVLLFLLLLLLLLRLLRLLLCRPLVSTAALWLIALPRLTDSRRVPLDARHLLVLFPQGKHVPLARWWASGPPASPTSRQERASWAP